MPQKLPANNESKIRFNLINIWWRYHFISFDGECPKKFRNGFPFFQEKKKIKKAEKLLTKLHDKAEYVIHIKKT